MARLTLDIPDDTHRKLKTLAAYFGMTMKDFLLSRAFNQPEREASHASAPSATGLEAERLDNLLFAPEASFKLSPANWDSFCAALEAPASINPPLSRLMTAPSVLDEQ